MLTSLDLPDQSGRTWLVTGATNGIGRSLALAVVRAGGRVIAPARNEALCRQLRHEARELPGSLVTAFMDLADLRSVRAFAQTVTEPVDVLVNNAGLVTPRRRSTADGFETTLGVNFLGPFALTNLLAHAVRDRVVIVGSDMHRSARVDLRDPHFRRRLWNPMRAYGQSKLCDVLWAHALQRHLDGRAGTGGADVPDVLLAHPGWAATNIHNVTPSAALNRAIGVVTGVIGQSASGGALPVAEAAVGEHSRLSYLGPGGIFHWRGVPTLQRIAPRGADPLRAQAVWEFGVRETGTDLPAA